MSDDLNLIRSAAEKLERAQDVRLSASALKEVVDAARALGMYSVHIGVNPGGGPWDQNLSKWHQFPLSQLAIWADFARAWADSEAKRLEASAREDAERIRRNG